MTKRDEASGDRLKPRKPRDGRISMTGITKTYRTGDVDVQALKGIDLVIEPGEMVAIWGPSGSGKSSLMNVIGLIDSPTKGRLDMPHQDDIYALPDDRLTEYRASNIGFIFQGFNLVPVLSALENIALPMQIQGVGNVESLERAAALLQDVGLSGLAASRPDRMSGGQRQRVAIARALASRPAIVIADEPTANLDTENSLGILELMSQMNKRSGVTFVFTTHDQRLLDRIGRKLLLRDGQLAKEE